MTQSTVDLDEIEKFNKISSQWWDPNGKFKPLHVMSNARLSYLQDQIRQHFGQDYKSKTLLDVGCGGGLISEPMARSGFNVTGIDASAMNIEVAEKHANESEINVNYSNMTSGEMLKTGKKFDIILALEIVEHVANVDVFLNELSQLLNDGGIMFVSTINRTTKSYLFAIIGAEYVMKWLPIGTHDWKKFLKPSEIATNLQESGLKLNYQTGMVFNPLKQTWSLNQQDLSVNYIMNFTK